jgi:hypothetical protein
LNVRLKGMLVFAHYSFAADAIGDGEQIMEMKSAGWTAIWQTEHQQPNSGLWLSPQHIISLSGDEREIFLPFLFESPSKSIEI